MESLILSALSAADILNPVKNFGMVAIGLGFVIFVHELGHFLVAKLCGVKVDKFYIGFDVPIPLGFFTIPGKLVHFQYGETEYGIGAIPLGGYVKMLGQDDNPQNAETESDRTKIRDEQGNLKLDPRSYPAKSVPARMAIISAGVIMNIIFGFIFASVAYQNGVMIQPAVVGSTSPGDPAWKMGLPIGTRILQVGKEGTPNEHMRFVKDMMLNLALYGQKYFEEDMDLYVEYPDGKREWIALRASDRYKKDKDIARPSIGIAPSRSTELGKIPSSLLPVLGPDYYNITAAQNGETIEIEDFDAVQQLMSHDASLVLELASKVKSGDKLVAIDGESVTNYADVERLLARRASQEIELTIERKASKESAVSERPAASAPERYELKLAPRPIVDYGLEMEMSPVTAVQKGSPAEKAGILPGDRLVSFNGEPVGDLLMFPQKTLAHIGETAEVEVERGEGGHKQMHKLQVKLREPQQTYWSMTNSSAAVETMGIAYNVSTKVASVRPGSSAEGQLQPGDEIIKVQFKTVGDAQMQTEAALHNDRPEEVEELDGKVKGWGSVVYEASTVRMPDTKLVVTAKRGDEEITAELIGTPSTENFVDHHGLGLALTGLEELHKAESWGEAFSLGAREMKERMLEVFTVVTRLVTGRISLFQMGGPISIFTMAGREAESGITDLLMFFAFLSANLAVLNFLPIPALDGGHMLFLLYEGIRRKPVDENLQMKLSAAGILSLLALMLFVTILDVQRLFW